MVMRFAITLLALACCIGATTAGNLDSASGYVLMPDAGIAPAGQWQYSAAYVAPRGTNELSEITAIFPCDGNGFNLRALYGIGGKTEAGIGYQNINKDAGDANAITLAAKTSLIDRPDSGMALSAGVAFRSWSTDMSVDAVGFTLDADLPNVTSLYVVLDKKWSAEAGSWVASIGVAYDNYSDTNQGTGGLLVADSVPIHSDGSIDSKGFIRPFFGASVMTGEWTFLFDYKSNAKSGGFTYQDTLWSIAGRRAVSTGLTATAGFTTWNIPYTKSDPGIFLDLTWVR